VLIVMKYSCNGVYVCSNLYCGMGSWGCFLFFLIMVVNLVSSLLVIDGLMSDCFFVMVWMLVVIFFFGMFLSR